jgi:hypothetical protein
MFFALVLMALAILWFGIHVLCWSIKDWRDKRAKASHEFPLRNKCGQPLTLLAWFMGLSLFVSLFIVGCASLTPGADPLVVRVEQGEAGANSTFDLILRLDNSDRGFWKTNAPAFHNFSEWLRTPISYTGTNLPRCVVMQLNVDDLKLNYQAARTSANSNALWIGFSVLDSALSQSLSWSNIVTQPTH